jgi:hypothetical protein
MAHKERILAALLRLQHSLEEFSRNLENIIRER